MIDLNDIAVEYSVLIDNKVTRIKVIDSKDLYEITDSLKSCDHKSIKKAQALAETIEGKCPSLYHVTWYASTESDYSIVNAVLQANIENNNIIVMEMLPDE